MIKSKKLLTVLVGLSIAMVGCNSTTNSESNTDLSSTNSENSIVESNSESSSSANSDIESNSASSSNSSSSSTESSSSTSSDSEIENNTFDVDLDALKLQYGEFNIVTEKGTPGVLSEDKTTYTIEVSSSKSSYTISGYFNGQIIINNASNLTSFKGVELTLNNACLVSDSGSTIEYQVDEKNVEVIAKKGTENYIINTSEGYNDCAISSNKNVEIDGKGVLNILTKTGHGIQADSKIRIYEAPTINITSNHDALHSTSFISNNEEEAEKDYKEFTGILNVLSASSQAFDCTNNKGTGSITITSGTYNISNCESVFKTDATLYINSTVIANNISLEPVVIGEKSNTLSILITENGSFTIDGVNYSKTVIGNTTVE